MDVLGVKLSTNSKSPFYQSSTKLAHDSLYGIELTNKLNKTSDALTDITNSEGVNIYFVNQNKNEIYLNPKYIVSPRHTLNWKIGPGSILAAYVAHKKEVFRITGLKYNNKYPQKLGYISDANVVICVPILSDDTCIGVIECYKKQGIYSDIDLQTCLIMSQWMGESIKEASEKYSLENENKFHKCLLKITSNVSHTHWPFEKLFSSFMMVTKRTINAEKGYFFVIDPDNTTMADIYEESLTSDKLIKKTVQLDLNSSCIVAFVARTGTRLNIPDVNQYPHFNREIDAKTGLITKSTMCFPIQNEEHILGVIQVINKVNDSHFNSSDEYMFQNVASFCAISLYFYRLKKTVTTKRKILQCHSEIVKRLLQPTSFELKLLSVQVTLPHSYNRFSWYYTGEITSMPLYAVEMMKILIKPEVIDPKDMVNFLFMVQKMHIPNQYHNFEHSFHVWHCMFLILKNNMERFEKIELYALIIASLCFHLDTDGLDNSVLKICNHRLSKLYEDSYQENYNYELGTHIINSCDLLSKLSNSDYKSVLSYLKQTLLLNNRLSYYKAKHYFENSMKNRKKPSQINHTHLKSVLIAGCEMYIYSKSDLFINYKLDQLFSEFYEQGDYIKYMNLSPIPYMDRTKKNLRIKEKISYVTVIVMPCFKLLYLLFPISHELLIRSESYLYNLSQVVDESKFWRPSDAVVTTTEDGHRTTIQGI